MSIRSLFKEQAACEYYPEFHAPICFVLMLGLLAEGGAMKGREVFAMASLYMLISQGAAHPQEMGSVQNFGDDGRLFHSGRDDYFLVSRQSYLTEDSFGYEGQVRIVRRYPAGGYEIKMKDYLARCRAVDDGTYVVWFEAGQRGDSTGITAEIKTAAKVPPSGPKESYNLFWAACHEVFKKFR